MPIHNACGHNSKVKTGANYRMNCAHITSNSCPISAPAAHAGVAWQIYLSVLYMANSDCQACAQLQDGLWTEGLCGWCCWPRNLPALTKMPSFADCCRRFGTNSRSGKAPLAYSQDEMGTIVKGMPGSLLETRDRLHVAYAQSSGWVHGGQCAKLSACSSPRRFWCCLWE